MQNPNECLDGDKANCIERTADDITIHDSYANVGQSELSGVNTRLGGGFRTGWGVVGMRGVWRRVTSAELRTAGEEDRLAIPTNVVRIGILARRGDLSAVWTASYRSSYTNRAGTGTFESWTGHDVVLDWADPLGLEGARITAGVFNITDAGLSINTATPAVWTGPRKPTGGALSSSPSTCGSETDAAVPRKRESVSRQTQLRAVPSSLSRSMRA